MGRAAAEASPAARAVFECADSALGFSLSKLCFEGPDEDLVRTEVQQPAILATSIALLRALEEKVPVRPGFVGGHSLGEYSALVAAGALELEDALRLVHARGRFMQEAVSEGRGAMAAVLGSVEIVREACARAREETGGIVTPANFNAPQQTVVAGQAAAVEIACTRARELGAKRTVPLAVSAPFHCELMEPAAEKLALELARVRFRDAKPPVVTNVEAEPNSDAARMPALLRAQVTAPVRFTDMVDRFRELGVTRYLEVGPGRVLSGLLARCQRGCERASLSQWSDLEEVETFLASSSESSLESSLESSD